MDQICIPALLYLLRNQHMNKTKQDTRVVPPMLPNNFKFKLSGFLLLLGKFSFPGGNVGVSE